MKEILVLILSTFSFLVYSQLPKLKFEFAKSNSIKSVTEWKYAIDSNGIKYESIKLASNVYDTLGNQIEFIDHEGVYGLQKEKAIYEYNDSKELVEWNYYIDTNIVKTAKYEYDTLSRLIKEVRKHKYDSLQTEILYSYKYNASTGIQEEITTCVLCPYTITVKQFDSINNLICQKVFNKDSLIYIVKLNYNSHNNLIREETIWNMQCDDCINKSISYKYNNKNQIVSETHFINENIVERNFIYEYNSLGINTRTLRTYEGNDKTLVSEYKYEFYN